MNYQDWITCNRIDIKIARSIKTGLPGRGNLLIIFPLFNFQYTILYPLPAFVPPFSRHSFYHKGSAIMEEISLFVLFQLS